MKALVLILLSFLSFSSFAGSSYIVDDLATEDIKTDTFSTTGKSKDFFRVNCFTGYDGTRHTHLDILYVNSENEITDSFDVYINEEDCEILEEHKRTFKINEIQDKEVKVDIIYDNITKQLIQFNIY